MTTQIRGMRAFSRTRGAGRTTNGLIQVMRQLRDGNNVILSAHSMEYNKELVSKIRKAMDALGFTTLSLIDQGAYYGFYIVHPITRARAHLFRGNQLAQRGQFENYKEKYNAITFTDHYRRET